MLIMLRLTPFVAHLMLVMVQNMPEQCSFRDMLFHMLFMPKYAEKYASIMDISLTSKVVCGKHRRIITFLEAIHSEQLIAVRKRIDSATQESQDSQHKEGLKI